MSGVRSDRSRQRFWILEENDSGGGKLVPRLPVQKTMYPSSTDVYFGCIFFCLSSLLFLVYLKTTVSNLETRSVKELVGMIYGQNHIPQYRTLSQ